MSETKNKSNDAKLNVGLIKKSLKLISETHISGDNKIIYPVNRRIKLIDMDGSVDFLRSKGWKNLKSAGEPSTPDTVLFRGKEIIPLEIKWRNKKKRAAKGTAKSQIDSLGKKLATFIYNIYRLNNIQVKEYWIVTSFHKEDEKNDLVAPVRVAALLYLEKIKDEKIIKKIKKFIENIKIEHHSAVWLENIKLINFNKEPSWFSNFYSEKTKIKNPVQKKTVKKVSEKPTKKVVEQKQAKKVSKKLVVQKNPVHKKSTKSATKIAIQGKIQKKNAEKAKKSNSEKEQKVGISSEKINLFFKQEEKFHRDLLDAFKILTVEVKNLRKKRRKFWRRGK